MKNVFKIKGLELNDKDNALTAAAKGGFSALIPGSLALGALWGTVMVIGKLINRNDEVQVFEEEFKAE